MRPAFRVLILLAAALPTGCAIGEESGNQGAGTGVKQHLEQEYVGDYGRSWDTLHPAHQRLVSRAGYEDCRRQIDVVGSIESVLVLDVKDARLSVFGLPANTAAKAVEVRVVTTENEFTATYHVVRVGEQWRWIFSDRAARGFKRTACPA